MLEFLEFIIIRCFLFVLVSLMFTAIMYYVEKCPLKESVGLGLYFENSLYSYANGQCLPNIELIIN